MKRTLPILSVALIVTAAVMMTACSSKPKTDAEKNLVLSASDTTGLADFQEWKVQNERKDPNLYYATGNTPAPVNAVRKTTAVKKSTGTTATKPVAAAKKKGWSKAAKGAAIGTAASAIAGVIISKKNPVLGGIIGGVAGGGIGYGIGRGMDKKDGRY
jgi:hypothetical protein